MILYIIGSRNDVEGIVCVKLVYIIDLVNIIVLIGSVNRIKGFLIWLSRKKGIKIVERELFSYFKIVLIYVIIRGRKKLLELIGVVESI